MVMADREPMVIYIEAKCIVKLVEESFQLRNTGLVECFAQLKHLFWHNDGKGF